MRFMMIVKAGCRVTYAGEIQVASTEEATEWVRRFPSPAIHRKELFELDDFGPSEAVAA